MTTSDAQRIAQLCTTLDHWEGTLRLNEKRYARQAANVSLARVRAQLDVIKSVRELLEGGGDSPF